MSQVYYCPKYGDFKLWDYDGRVSRVYYFADSFIDKECLWIISQKSVDITKQWEQGALRGAGIAINPYIADIDFRLLLQTAIDQWGRVSQPVELGGLLPTPRGLFFDKDGEEDRAAKQPILLSMTLDGGQPVYFYDRSKYRLERVANMCDENQEAFRIVEN